MTQVASTGVSIGSGGLVADRYDDPFSSAWHNPDKLMEATNFASTQFCWIFSSQIFNNIGRTYTAARKECPANNCV
jgi:hypothetical protein